VNIVNNFFPQIVHKFKIFCSGKLKNFRADLFGFGAYRGGFIGNREEKHIKTHF